MFIKDLRHGSLEPEDFDIDSKTPFKYLFDTKSDEELLTQSSNTVEALDDLAKAMIDATPPDGSKEAVPAIYTYWSQFIDHELTARTDRTTTVSDITVGADDLQPVERATVERDLLNRRTPALELDVVYGEGLPGRHGMKSRSSHARDLELSHKLRDGNKLRVGTNTVAVDPDGKQLIGALVPTFSDLQRDLPRIGPLLDLGVLKLDDLPPELRESTTLRQRAFIGDPRNDENLIVAQFHVAMLRFHNAVVDYLQFNTKRFDPPAKSDLFEDAQRVVRWTFQWLVVNDFLKTLLREDQLKKVLDARASKYFKRADHGNEPYMPIEFSVACYRFGHSMVRGAYDYNRNFGRQKDAADSPDGNLRARATLDQLFEFTGKHKAPFRGAPTVPHNWIIEWQRFDGSSKLPGRTARLIDTRLDNPLGDLLNEGKELSATPTPEEERINKLLKQLAQRNLRRGYHLSLPTGQALATALDIKPLTAAEIRDGNSEDVNEALDKGGFAERTPLWFYTLKEAELEGGTRLGPLGSRVVAETIIGVLIADPESYLVKQPSWNPSKPILGVGGPVKLSDGRSIQEIGDLLEFAGVKVKPAGG